MKKLRSFIYLDNYKMYSISSQLFEGLTEYIVKSKTNNIREEESQKGPIGSGKILADIIETDVNQTEKKFLHDYSYNLFEDKLYENGNVLEIDSENIDDNIKKLDDFSFVKITGNVAFNDLKLMEDTLLNFNKIGEALGYITHKAEYDEQIKEYEETIKNIKDRNQKAKAKAIFKSSTEFKKILKEQGLQLEEDYLKHMAYILDYGYNQQFEVQIPIKTDEKAYHLFSAQLNRDNLKDNEYSIIKKYSRETEKKFKLFGIITQKLSQKEKDDNFNSLKLDFDDIENPSMKEAVMNMVSAITNIEKSFTGKLDYEYIIDPIAMYIEI